MGAQRGSAQDGIGAGGSAQGGSAPGRIRAGRGVPRRGPGTASCPPSRGAIPQVSLEGPSGVSQSRFIRLVRMKEVTSKFTHQDCEIPCQSGVYGRTGGIHQCVITSM